MEPRATDLSDLWFEEEAGQARRQQKRKIFLAKYIVTKPITSPQLLRIHLALADKRYGNSSLFINSWDGISELGPRRHKKTQQQCVLLAPDPVTTARLETHNVYPDINAQGARAGRRRNRWDRLRDNRSKSRLR
ncbi:hypothetical protein TNCV_4033021 [Trichonephila clavipes]|nr:hypothetical protein TNCV_4033021 [Trichonephila clavipes]